MVAREGGITAAPISFIAHTVGSLVSRKIACVPVDRYPMGSICFSLINSTTVG